MKEINILIVDDHSLFRQTLAFILNRNNRFRVTGEAGNADMAFALATEKRPDVILMDINMHAVDGFSLTEKLLAYSGHFKIIALSLHAVVGIARRIMKAGAMGYVTKNSGIEELVACIASVYNGKKHVCEEMRDVFVQQEFDPAASTVNVLSARELDIARLIRDGLSSKDISCRLNIAISTVGIHRYNILKKLNLKNRVALVNFINHNGL